ncbi:MAG: hypothetical protein KKC69_07575, partial [Acidobacteria bacterium]|nr:hypothetical protein [Acidobacteriota bacterium]
MLRKKATPAPASFGRLKGGKKYPATVTKNKTTNRKRKTPILLPIYKVDLKHIIHSFFYTFYPLQVNPGDGFLPDLPNIARGTDDGLKAHGSRFSGAKERLIDRADF